MTTSYDPTQYIDDLFPRGRPACRTCGERPVYMAGECGRCLGARPEIDGDEPVAAEDMEYNAADNLGGIA